MTFHLHLAAGLVLRAVEGQPDAGRGSIPLPEAASSAAPHELSMARAPCVA